MKPDCGIENNKMTFEEYFEMRVIEHKKFMRELNEWNKEIERQSHGSA